MKVEILLLIMNLIINLQRFKAFKDKIIIALINKVEN